MTLTRSIPGASPVPAPTRPAAPDASRFAVEAGEGGMRLDQFLVARIGGELSRSRVQSVIEAGGVLVGGLAVQAPSRKVLPGETVEMAVPDAAEPDPVAEDIPLRILFEDDDLVVIDKPPGLVVHPGPGNWTGTLVNALLHHCGASLSGIGGVKRPGIVHRLDKDTSGVMVVAKNDVAHRSLSEQFASHGRDGRLERAYLAAAWGLPARPKGSVEAALGRSTADRLKRQVVPPTRADARHAVTHYTVLARSDRSETALLRCVLETGRTHQIRVHLAHIGHPLIGDDLYGGAFRTKAKRLDEPARTVVTDFGRQALHAHTLGFRHPATGQAMRFESPLPPDMTELIAALGLDT